MQDLKYMHLAPSIIGCRFCEFIGCLIFDGAPGSNVDDSLDRSLFSLQTIMHGFPLPLLTLVDPRGGAPLWGSKFFHFHAVFGTKLKNNSFFGSWRNPLGKILDPPLINQHSGVDNIQARPPVTLA